MYKTVHASRETSQVIHKANNCRTITYMLLHGMPSRTHATTATWATSALATSTFSSWRLDHFHASPYLCSPASKNQDDVCSSPKHLLQHFPGQHLFQTISHSKIALSSSSNSLQTRPLFHLLNQVLEEKQSKCLIKPIRTKVQIVGFTFIAAFRKRTCYFE